VPLTKKHPHFFNGVFPESQGHNLALTVFRWTADGAGLRVEGSDLASDLSHQAKGFQRDFLNNLKMDNPLALR